MNVAVPRPTPLRLSVKPLLLAVGLACVGVVALAMLAGRYLTARDYLMDVAFNSVMLVVLIILASRADRFTARAAQWTMRVPVPVLAALFLVAAFLATFLVLENVPHVSDEAAYQFQARALALGKLAIATPAHIEFFDIVHTVNDGSKWYGIMNPGWPMLLAIGELMRVPWLVNPLLGALTLLVAFSFFKRAGYSPAESRIAVLIMAVSPFVLFMAGTLMAHTANLLVFVLFLWAWTAVIDQRSTRHAVLAGALLALNLLIRPIDSAIASLPFVIQLCYRALRDRRLLPHVFIVGSIASLGIVATMLYNAALTGDAFLMPTTKFFMDLNPHEKFGMGFGPDMGTKLHGPEWPGYYPADAVRVTSHRLAEVLRGFIGQPIVLLALLILPFARRNPRKNEWHTLLLLSGAALVAVYFLHFYHGIAYGSRHYFLAVPALAAAIARPLASALESTEATVSRWARYALVGGLACTLTVPYAKLVREYGHNYREASSIIRRTIKQQHLSNAVVFVATDRWAWKSAFPLNRYPLEKNDVLLAKDRGADNLVLMRSYPGRSAYLLKLGKASHVEVTPLSTSTNP